MKSLKNTILIGGLWFASVGTLFGCAHSVHHAHIVEASPYVEYAEGRVVKTKTEQFVVLHFTFDTDYVDKCYRKLLEECPGGYITGVTTRYWTSLGLFSWTNKMEMQGICFQNSSPNSVRN